MKPAMNHAKQVAVQRWQRASSMRLGEIQTALKRRAAPWDAVTLRHEICVETNEPGEDMGGVQQAVEDWGEIYAFASTHATRARDRSRCRPDRGFSILGHIWLLEPVSTLRRDALQRPVLLASGA